MLGIACVVPHDVGHPIAVKVAEFAQLPRRGPVTYIATVQIGRPIMQFGVILVVGGIEPHQISLVITIEVEVEVIPNFHHFLIPTLHRNLNILSSAVLRRIGVVAPLQVERRIEIRPSTNGKLSDQHFVVGIVASHALRIVWGGEDGAVRDGQ